MSAQTVSSQLEALLFISGEPVAKARLAELLAIDQSELTAAAERLNERYQNDAESGLMLIEHRGKIELATKKELVSLVEKFTQSNFQETLSKAALEVLSIVAYRAPISRSEIEAIRGVNCSYTLRSLLIRGLIERQGNPEDARGYIYHPTFQFLEHLGLAQVNDLPDYATLANDERVRVIAPEKSVIPDIQIP